MRTVAIIGVGNVGSTIAKDIIQYEYFDEILLCDIDEDKVWAEKEDLKHSCIIQKKSISCYVASCEECSAADIVIISASAKYYKGMQRKDFANSSIQIVSSIISSLTRSNFRGIYIVVTNPVDLMTHFVLRRVRQSFNKVIGAGTILDTARLKTELFTQGIDKTIDLVCIGEHGESLIVPFSTIVAGTVEKDIHKIYNISNELLPAICGISNRIVESKKFTNWGISASVMRILDAIVNDARIPLSVSHMVHKPYLNDMICFGYPATIGTEGIINEISLDLLKNEQQFLQELVVKSNQKFVLGV